MKFKAKLIRTIRNNAGDIFSKGSIVTCKKSYGGYTLTKIKRKKTLIIGTASEYFMRGVSVSRVSENDFIKL